MIGVKTSGEEFMSRLYWSGEGLIFGHMPTPNEQEKLKVSSLRVLEWWRDLHRRHNELRKYARKGPLYEELARNVLTFWREWFLYDHGRITEENREWLAMIRRIRLDMILMLAKRLGAEELAQVNELAIHTTLPCFGSTPEGVKRAMSAREQFVPSDSSRKGIFWWPYEMPTPQGFQTELPPHWDT